MNYGIIQKNRNKVANKNVNYSRKKSTDIMWRH